MSRKSIFFLGRLLFLAGAIGLVAALILPNSIRAENFSELEIDQFYKVAAENVTLDNGYVQMSLPLGGTHLLRIAAERVRCLTNCPDTLVRLTQLVAAGRLPSNPRGFQIHGSNTIGAELMPELVEGYLTARQAEVDSGGLDKTTDPKVPRRDITFTTDKGVTGKIEIFSGGSGTGFEKLRSKQAALWMSSRPASQKEIGEFANLGLGNLLAPENEHVIALDGLAVVAHPSNPVGVVSLDDLARIYSGEIKDWSELNGPSGPIKVFRRSDDSGTNSTFKELVMAPFKKDYGAMVKPIVDTEELQAEIQRDEAAIGFIGFGFVSDGLKMLAIRTKCGMAYRPDKLSIKTEEYPLSRRLLVYTAGAGDNAMANDLLNFTLGSDGQKIVEKRGFVELSLSAPEKFEAQASRIANMLAAGASDLESTKNLLDTIRFAERLPLTIRFKKDSVDIDNKGERDLRTLAEALTRDIYQNRELLLVGFSDDQNQPTALKLSEERARIVARTLQMRLKELPRKSKPITIYEQNVKWFGSAGPIACNDDEHSRALNRRVEVWIR